MALSYSTHGLSLEQSATLVQDVADRYFGKSFNWTPLPNVEFAVDISLRSAGEVMIARNKSMGFCQDNVPTQGRHSMRRFSVHAAVDGAQRLVSDGQLVSLQPGQFILLDTSRSCSREQLHRSDTISLNISEDVMRREVPYFERLLHHTFGTEDPLPKTIFELLRQTTEVGDFPHSDSASRCMSRTILNLLGMLADNQLNAHGPSNERLRKMRVREIRQYIDDNLTDPELSLEQISRAMSLSTRYLHMLFSNEPLSIPKIIRASRLIKAAENLRHEHLKSRSITEIVLDCGFNDISHFCRLFKEEYAMSARDYRKAVHRTASC